MHMTGEDKKKVKLSSTPQPSDTVKPKQINETEVFFSQPLPLKDQHTLYQTIHKHLNFQVGTFPGTHNITFMRKHFTNLLEEDYLCAEKSDGKRILLLIVNLNFLETNKLTSNDTKNIKIFWIDRTNNIFIQNELTLKSLVEPPQNTIEYFLFDCELIKTFNNEMRLYIFDTLIFFNKSVCKEDLLGRLEYARLFLKYFNIEYQNRDKSKGDSFFKIHLKEMYKSYGFAEIYNNVHKLNHKNDGLCFTPVKGAYSIGIDLNWLKWKPSNLNTIDFIVVKMNPFIDSTFTAPKNFLNPISASQKDPGIFKSHFNNDSGIQEPGINTSDTFEEIYKPEDDIVIYGLFVSKTDNSPIFFDYYIPFYDSTSKELRQVCEKESRTINTPFESESICEFQFNENIYVYSIMEDCFVKGGWTLYKIRKDKTKPNTVKIAKNIMIAISERIDIKDLEIKYNEMRNNWKKRNP